MDLRFTPVDTVVAALSTESSTMEELKWICIKEEELRWFCAIHVRTFMHCTTNTFDLCVIWEVGHVHLELHASSFVCFRNTS